VCLWTFAQHNLAQESYSMIEPDAALSEHLALLQEKHRILDEEINRLEQYPYRDQLQLQRLKKEKLRIKESIQKVRTMMIPDLDA